MPKTKVGPKKLKSPKTKYLWNNRYFYRAHRLALEGLTNQQIATILNVSPEAFAAWIKKRPSLRDALREGREERKAMKNNLSGYIFDRLSEPARQVWERLVICWEEPDPSSRERKLRAVLDSQDSTTLKSLFLHAVAFTRFDPSEAMKMVGVSRKQVKEWAATDTQFLEALDEIEEHKKNWFESKLLNLVHTNHDKAILMVNQTYNADRGYGRKTQVSSNAVVNHVHHGEVALTLDNISRYLDTETLEKLHRAAQALRLEHAQKVEVRQVPALPGRTEDTAIVDGEVLVDGEEAD